MQTSKSTPSPSIPQGLTPHQATTANNVYWAAFYRIRPTDSSDFIAVRVAQRAVDDYVSRIRTPIVEEV